MYFSEIIKRSQKDEKNPINKMYFTEIGIKWRKIEAVCDDYLTDKCNEKDLAAAYSDFIDFLAIPKFTQSNNSKGGFKPSSPLFSCTYLDDILTLMTRKMKILEFPGTKWGYQSFTSDMRYNLSNLYVDKIDKVLKKSISPKFLSFLQTVDFQFRMSGTRNFQKHTLQYPILIFSNHKVFHEKDFIFFEYESQKAKNTFHGSTSIVVAEYIENGWYPNLKNSAVDSIFVLRKQHANEKKPKALSADILIKLKQKIFDCLFEEEEKRISFRVNGIIE